MEAREQRTFWERHIASWSASAYRQNQALPLIELIARPFRGHLRRRRDLGVELVAKSGAARVLELGCGTGEFAAALIRASPTLKGYLGFDIAEPAVARACERLRLAAGSKVEYEVRTAAVEELDPAAFTGFEFVVALGLLPYLTDDGLEKLAAICRGRKFLFDYHPSELSLTNVLHFIYRKAKGYPFYRILSEQAVKEMVSRFGFGKFEIVRHGGSLRFVQSV